MAANATFALKAGVWVRRVRLLIVSPDSTGTACPLSGRNSTYRPVQISGAGSGGLPPPKRDRRAPHGRGGVLRRADRHGSDEQFFGAKQKVPEQGYNLQQARSPIGGADHDTQLS
jgi:hypothetical protein